MASQQPKRNKNRKTAAKKKSAATYNRADLREGQSVVMPSSRRRDRAALRADIGSLSQRFRIGPAGIAFGEALLDPFDDDGSVGGVMSVASHVCDHDGRLTYLITATGQATITLGTSGGVLFLPGLCRGADATSIDESMVMLFGADPNVLTNTPVSRSNYFDEQAVTLGGLLGVTAKIRPISAGIKVNAVSPPDETAGKLTAWLATSNLRSAENTMGIAYSTALTQRLGESCDMKDGITVRRPYRDTDRALSTIPQYSYNAGALLFPMPCVTYSGASATTIVDVRWVYHYEVECSTAMPFKVVHGVNEPDFPSIVSFCNERPLVSLGHSFKGFLGQTWNILKKVAVVAGTAAIGGLVAAPTAGLGAMVAAPVLARIFAGSSPPAYRR